MTPDPHPPHEDAESGKTWFDLVTGFVTGEITTYVVALAVALIVVLVLTLGELLFGLFG